MKSIGTARPAIVDANRAEYPIEVGHRRVRDALSFPEGCMLSNSSVQWFMKAAKLTHSHITTRTNVHFHFGPDCEVLLCVQLPDTGQGRSECCCLNTTAKRESYGGAHFVGIDQRHKMHTLAFFYGMECGFCGFAQALKHRGVLHNDNPNR